LLATYPDAERVVRNYLAEQLTDLGEICTVRVGVPSNWTPATGTHLQIALDGTPTGSHPIMVDATIRLVAWAANTTDAKRLAALAQGVLLAHGGGGGIARTAFLTGVQPARDPSTRAEIASTTTRVTVRSTPIDAGS